MHSDLLESCCHLLLILEMLYFTRFKVIASFNFLPTRSL